MSDNVRRVRCSFVLFCLFVGVLVPGVLVSGEAVIRVPFDYVTIQEAVDAASPGDVIEVSSGVYNETVYVPANLTGLVLRGEGRGSTVINGNMSGVEEFWFVYTLEVDASEVEVSGFTFSDGFIGGMINENANDFNFHDNKITGCFYALMSSAPKSRLIDCIIHDNDAGVNLAAESRIVNCSIKNENVDLVLKSDNNWVENNDLGSVTFLYSSNNTLRNNNLTDLVLEGWEGVPEDYVHDIDESNLLEGKNLRYMMNENNLIIDGSESPDIFYTVLFNSSNILFKNLNMTGNRLILAYCDNITVSDSHFSMEGLHLFYTNNSEISRCTFIDPSTTISQQYQNAIILPYSNNIIIKQNYISSYPISISHGWVIGSSLIINNTFIDNDIAFHPIQQSNCVLYGNNFINNWVDLFGVEFFPQKWDNSQGFGNYWDRYNSSDDDYDGIGDISYQIDEGNNTDYYPLMYPNPRAYVTADAGSDVTINEDESMVLDASNSWAYPEIDECSWSIGKTVTLAGREVNYLFSTPGVYEVELTVYNPEGFSHTDIVTVTVQDITKPSAEAGPEITINTGEEASFNASDCYDNGCIKEIIWDFGDGTNHTGESCSHIYTEAGTYTVKVTVEDIAGNTNTDTTKVTVVQQSTGIPISIEHWILGIITSIILLYILRKN